MSGIVGEPSSCSVSSKETVDIVVTFRYGGPMKILILGAGFGGLELATHLSGEIGSTAEITVIDERPGFVFGFSKLDVMFGKLTAESVFHPYGG